MSKAFEANYQKKYNGDVVINRGYAIYDGWKANKLSSRKIVACAENAAKATKQNNTVSKSIEALAYLFALDLRIREKYGTLLRCVLSYPSYSRETRALKRIKEILHIANYSDIRSAIEVELQRIREKLDGEASDEGDDETHGGRRNGKAEEEAVAEGEKGQEQITEEDAKEFAEAEETDEAKEEVSREKAEDSPDQAMTEDQIQDSGDERQSDEPSREMPTEVAQAEKEPLKEDAVGEVREEKNEPTEGAEPSEEKQTEERAYNDAVDSPPIFEDRESEVRPDNATSFIDDVIIDNMVKGKENYVTHNPLEDVKADKDASKADNVVADKNAEATRDINRKDDYLYDKMVLNERDLNAAQSQERMTQEKSDTKQETKPVQNDEKGAIVNAEREETRVSLQVDITESQENAMRGEINEILSREMIDTIISAQEELMREQLTILSEELAMDSPVEIVGKPDHTQTSQPSVAPNRR